MLLRFSDLQGGRILIDGKDVKYTATAGTLPIRLDDGKVVDVQEISEDHVCISASLGKKGSSWSGVLVLPARELPISGTIDKEGDRTVVALDLLVEEYKLALSDYLTRVQMLDFVV